MADKTRPGLPERGRGENSRGSRIERSRTEKNTLSVFVRSRVAKGTEACGPQVGVRVEKMRRLGC